MDNITRLKNLAQNRILILDGAMGTLIRSLDLDETEFKGEKFAKHATSLSGNYDILTLTKPDLISSIHHCFFKAGADIIKTNTFSGSVVEQDHYKTSDHIYEMNLNAAKLAGEEAAKFTSITHDKPRFVAGVVGPIRYTCSKVLSDKVGFEYRSYEKIKSSYAPQIQGLIDGGVDFLLIETIFCAENAKAALSVLNDINKKTFPVWLSATVIPKFENNDIENLINELIDISKDYNLFCLGLNCSVGTEHLEKNLEYLKNNSSSLVSIYPSAGLPDKNGKYPISAKMFSDTIRKLVDKNLVNIVGGCCGTTPEYIHKLSEEV